MRNLLLNTIFFCFLSYLIVITPFISWANIRFAPTITYADKLRTNLMRGKLTRQQQNRLVSLQAGKLASSDGTSKKNLLLAYMKLPLFFIKNEGQLGKKVKFYSKGNSYTIFFTEDEVVYSFAQESVVHSKEQRTTNNCQPTIPGNKAKIHRS